MEIILLGFFLYGFLANWNGSSDTTRHEAYDNTTEDPLFYEMMDESGGDDFS